MKWCKGDEEHIELEELESRVWREDDLYKLTCSKCGRTGTSLARRPNQASLMCGEIKE